MSSCIASYVATPLRSINDPTPTRNALRFLDRALGTIRLMILMGQPARRMCGTAVAQEKVVCAQVLGDVMLTPL